MVNCPSCKSINMSIELDEINDLENPDKVKITLIHTCEDCGNVYLSESTVAQKNLKLHEKGEKVESKTCPFFVKCGRLDCKNIYGIDYKKCETYQDKISESIKTYTCPIRNTCEFNATHGCKPSYNFLNCETYKNSITELKKDK